MLNITRAVLATVVISAAVLAQTSAAHAANQYGVELTNNYSSLKADVMWASTQPYQGVFLWPNNRSASQEFDLLYSANGSGSFRIRARHSGLCLMLDFRAPYTNGTRVIQYSCNATGVRSMWWYRASVSPQQTCDDGVCTSTGITYTVLKNSYTKKCLDADNGAGGAPRRQAVLQQWTCIRTADDWNAGNQLWHFGNEKSL